MFEGTKLSGDGVIVRKPDNLGNVEVNAIAGKKLLSEEIDRVAVGDKIKIFGNRFEFDENIIDGEYGGLIVTVFADTVRSDDFLGSVEEEKDIVPNAFDFDISLITAVFIGKFIGEMIDKRLHSESDGVTVVRDRLMGNLHAVHIEHEGGGFP